MLLYVVNGYIVVLRKHDARRRCASIVDILGRRKQAGLAQETL
jgi:hypothetical protein